MPCQQKSQRFRWQGEPSVELSQVYPGEVPQQAENVQQPQDHGNDHDGVQNRLYGSRHRDVPVDESQKDADDDQHQHYLK